MSRIRKHYKIEEIERRLIAMSNFEEVKTLLVEVKSNVSSQECFDAQKMHFINLRHV